jgi:hypothetical protein
VKRLKKGHFRALVARKDHSDPSNQLIATSCLLGELYAGNNVFYSAPASTDAGGECCATVP